MQHRLIAGEKFSKSGETLTVHAPVIGEVVEEALPGDAEDSRQVRSSPRAVTSCSFRRHRNAQKDPDSQKEEST